MAEFLLRDIFSQQTIDYIADLIVAAWGAFPQKKFQELAGEGLDTLSFGDRSRQITEALAATLPQSYPKTARILVRSLGPEPEGEELGGYEGFYIMPMTGYVSSRGIEHPDISLDALYEMTKRFSAEGDIRPFIRRYRDKTLSFLESLTEDPSPFARRLASEGTRPRLPLAGRLPAFQKDPSPVIGLLDRLYTDSNLMVRRSVANNVNDIAKDNPDVAVATLQRWKSENPSAELDWIIGHALRTLIKQNHPGALSLLGYNTTEFLLRDFHIDKTRIVLGDPLMLSWRVHSTSSVAQKLVMNYVVHFLKANGQNKAKVFRLPSRQIEPGQTLELSKTHTFRPFRNQTFYAGPHLIEVQVNGVGSQRKEFDLALE